MSNTRVRTIREIRTVFENKHVQLINKCVITYLKKTKTLEEL